MGTRIVRRNQNHLRIIMIVLGVLLLAAGLGFAGWRFYDKTHAPKVAHLSVDDATEIFMDIYRRSYDSIFENQVLGQLKELHEEYGIVVSLYIYEELDDFAIWEMPTDYKAEFHENADWLKIGFHSISQADPAESGLTREEYEAEFQRTESAIKRFAGSDVLTRVLRLHYWYATDEMRAFLQEEGVEALLCSETPKGSYSLTQKQEDKLYRSRDGKLVADLTYFVTDFRLENMEDVTAELEAHSKDRIMVLFTHAWCFQENVDKMIEAIEWLQEAEYTFTDLNMTQ